MVEQETVNEEVVTSDYTCTPATTEIEGPLGEYATVKDKTYSLVEENGFGADSYNLNIDFDVKTAHTFTEPLEITVTFYDEDGNQVAFPTDSGSDYSVFSSMSAGFIQMALKKGQNSDRTSVMICYKEIKDFTPDMLGKIKTFKVHSKLDEGEVFNYDTDLYE